MAGMRGQDGAGLSAGGGVVIDPEMLALLGCPLEPERPGFDLIGSVLVCTSCGHGFRIVDGVPDLLPESAIPPEQLEEMLK